MSLFIYPLSLVALAAASYPALILLHNYKNLLHTVYHRRYPAKRVLLDLIIESVCEITEPCIATCYYNVLEVVVFDVLGRELKRFEDSAYNASLIHAYILWVEQYLWYLEALLIQRYVLCVDACCKIDYKWVLSSSTLTA